MVMVNEYVSYMFGEIGHSCGQTVSVVVWPKALWLLRLIDPEKALELWKLGLDDGWKY